LEDGIDVGLRADAHVLLAETPHMGLDIGELLQRNKSSNTVCSNLDKGELTSCSARGIFWSFILWTPADAEPSSIAAVKSAPFMIATRKLYRRVWWRLTIRSIYVYGAQSL
jgi:hypothetical protein